MADKYRQTWACVGARGQGQCWRGRLYEKLVGPIPLPDTEGLTILSHQIDSVVDLEGFIIVMDGLKTHER